MTANEWDNPAMAAPLLYGDADIKAVSGVPVPSLRVLQAVGAIRSEKIPKEYGGFHRMWSEMEVLKAAIAAALNGHFAWNIRLVAKVMANVGADYLEKIIANAIADLKEGEIKDSTPVTTLMNDWLLELINRKFLFFMVPEKLAEILPNMAEDQTYFLLGIVSKDYFMWFPSDFGSPERRAQIQKSYGTERYQQMERISKEAMLNHDNFLSRSTVNISMQARIAWYQLRGHKDFVVGEAIQPGKRGSDQ